MLNKKLEQLEIQMPHGRIPREVLEEIWALCNEDEAYELAGKLAIASLEYALCGTTNYEDDKELMRELRHYKDGFERNLDNYNMECESRAIDQQYEIIAKLYWQDHLTQEAVAVKLGGKITQQEISRRLKKIRKDYPELYDKYHGK